MARTIDQIRASKLPSNMMQFAARGALQVAPAENIEILVYLALHNKVFGELARMTLAGWDEKACLAAASDPQTNREVLDYFISPDNLRPKLLPALLENSSVPEAQIVKLATSAMRDIVEIILKSKRALSLPAVVNVLKSNPYLKKEEVELLQPKPSAPIAQPDAPVPAQSPAVGGASDAQTRPEASAVQAGSAPVAVAEGDHAAPPSDDHDEVVTGYIKDHAADIAAEGEKPFQAIGGVVELLGHDYFPVVDSAEITKPPVPAASASTAAAKPAAKPAATQGKLPVEPKRENTLQKINRLDVKGRIQLALKGNKEERSILIRDGTKVVALAVLEAPKLADGEVEKFASQKNVLEAVLRQIPLKRRFVKNYIVVRNLCANPRTPLDIGLKLMKNLLVQDLKNISANKEVSETIRKLAFKMFKQKVEEANKK
ncbi:MAG: hypothetical protein LAP86_06885 [Acidobacteriia bacterium]|nr:hypothetical protein [Terriglobia bacterium]